MELFDEALIFACRKHSGQRRKLSETPYFLHPMEVATIVGTMTDDQNLIAAALLHDTVEDTDTTLEEIRENFGKRVSLLVMTETEDKRENLPPEATWRMRKEETLLILESTKDIDVKKLWLGDKLSNIRSFCREYRKNGDAFWNKFNQKDPSQQEWYYRRIADALSELSGYDAYKEYIDCINELFSGKGVEEI